MIKMKMKLICIVITSMFLLTSFSVFVVAVNQGSSVQIILSYSFEKPVIEKVDIGDSIYDRVIMAGAPCGGDSGEPRLPSRGAYILLPQKTRVNKITVTSGDKICLGPDYIVEPVGESVPISKITTAPMPSFNEEIYSSNDMFPGRFFTEIGTYSFRGYNILVLKLHPVQYVPVTGELFYYSDLTVSVDTVENGDANLLFRGLEKDKNEVIRKIDNPSVAGTYTQTGLGMGSTDDYDLLIITSDVLKDGFKSLALAHDTTGVRTIIKTLSDIDGSTPEDIRDYIRDAYNNLGIEYVLMGGDSDLVPAKELWVEAWSGGDTTFLPSDLYYACLDGPFNSDNDDRWGEPNDGENGGDVDLVAEVYIGRACVGNMQEVNNFVSKTLTYISTDPSDEYLKNVLMVGEMLDPLEEGNGTWGGNHTDEFIDVCNKHGYITTGIPSDEYNIDKLYDRNWEENGWPKPDGLVGGWPKRKLITRINNNIHIINGVGHGHIVRNMKMWRSDIYRLRNNKYCFICSWACSSGDFDDNGYGDCIAEYFTVKTSHGAFAGIWNSDAGWGEYLSTDGASQRYSREFWDAVFNESLSVISEANQDSKEDNIWRIGENCMRWCYYELNLFGDPAVDLFNHFQNNQPNKPATPSGPTHGKIRVEYEYTTCATDPDGHPVQYGWDWDDIYPIEWTDFYPSGTPVTVFHSWIKNGSREIKVKARDVFGSEGEWSDPLNVVMPRNKKVSYSHNSLFLRLLERFSNEFPILRHILGL